MTKSRPGASNDRQIAEELLGLARTEPAAAHERGVELAARSTNPAAASVALRAAGVAARHVATMSDSIGLLERSLEIGRSATPDVETEAALSLSGSYALAGRTEDAVGLLVRHRPQDELLGARFDFQRATILGRQGDAAAHAYEQAG